MPRDLQTIADELSRANQALVDAVSSRDLEAAGRIAGDTERLQRELDKALAAAKIATPAGYSTTIPVRDRVIHVLNLTKSVTPARLLSDLSFAVFGEPIAATALSTLRRDEMSSWRKAQAPSSRTPLRDVYVVPALSHDRLAPVRASLSLSDWSPERRIVAPLSPRVDLLSATVTLAEQALVDGESSKVLKVLAKLGHQSPFEPVDVNKVSRSASAELDELVAPDSRARREAAKRFAALDAESRLFGCQLRPVAKGRARRGTGTRGAS